MHVFMIFAAKYLFIVGPLLLVIVWARLNKLSSRSLLLRTISCGIMCGAFAVIGPREFHEQRPFALMHVAPLIPHIANNPFPSDHTLIASVCAFLLFAYSRPAGIVAGIVAAIVAWARVATLLDSPIDIGAAVLGAILAVLVSRLLIRRKPKSGRAFRDNDPKTKRQEPSGSKTLTSAGFDKPVAR